MPHRDVTRLSKIIQIFDIPIHQKSIGEIQVSQIRLKSPIQNAVQYTLLISLIYIIYKFANPSSPSGTAFITYVTLSTSPTTLHYIHKNIRE